jgi:excisionase family DNA binding protein
VVTEVRNAMRQVQAARETDGENCVLLSMEQAAAVAHTTVDAVRALIRRHQIPVMSFGGRRRFVKRADLMAFLKSRQFT